MPNSWEVEQKYRVQDPPQLIRNLATMGFSERVVELHEDTYLRHPCRDFRATDEAFRVRVVNETCCLTYKGPREPGIVKTRPEIELHIASAELAQWRSMLQLLGFAPLPTVKKKRLVFRSDNPSQTDLIVTVDSVEQLGEFAEIELLVSHRDALPSAHERIVALGMELGLSQVERRSYLAQLLEKLGIE